MATPAFFGKGFLQFGREPAGNWGAGTTTTHRMPCTVIDIQSGSGRIRSNSMDNSRVRGAIYAGGIKARIVIEYEMQYVTGTLDPNGFLMLQDAIHGTATFGSRGFTSSAGPTYTHTYTIGDLMNSLVLHVGDGAPGGDADSVLMTGMKVVEAVWTWGSSYEGEDNIPKCRLTLVGKLSTTNTAITALGFNPQTPDPILSSHCAITDGYGGSTGIFNNVTVTYKTGILEDGHYIGSNYIREPIASDFATCEVEMTGDFDSWTKRDAFLARTATTGILGFTFTKPGGTEIYTLKVASGKAYVMDHSAPLTTPGIIRETYRFESIRDTSSSNEAFVSTITCEAPASEG